jgi:hypothetical protein
MYTTMFPDGMKFLRSFSCVNGRGNKVLQKYQSQLDDFYLQGNIDNPESRTNSLGKN